MLALYCTHPLRIMGCISNPSFPHIYVHLLYLTSIQYIFQRITDFTPPHHLNNPSPCSDFYYLLHRFLSKNKQAKMYDISCHILFSSSPILFLVHFICRFFKATIMSIYTMNFLFVNIYWAYHIVYRLKTTSEFWIQIIYRYTAQYTYICVYIT